MLKNHDFHEENYYHAKAESCVRDTGGEGHAKSTLFVRISAISLRITNFYVNLRHGCEDIVRNCLHENLHFFIIFEIFPDFRFFRKFSKFFENSEKILRKSELKIMIWSEKIFAGPKFTSKICFSDVFRRVLSE